jgi:hypothetical protein
MTAGRENHTEEVDMSKKLDARLSEIDRKFGLSTEDDDEEGTVEERKRKRKKKEEVREVILREGVAVFDEDTGNAYITLDEAELSLDDRLSEVDERHGVRVG